MIIILSIIIILFVIGIIKSIDKSKRKEVSPVKKSKDLNEKKKELEKSVERRNMSDYNIRQTSELNTLGMEYEKNGDITSAIETYEECVSLLQPATHAYDRLLVLYRKLNRYEDELRIARLAIDVFTEENERRAKCAIQDNPEFEEDINLALETNEKLGKDNDFYVFVPYNVFKYIERSEKIMSKIERQKTINTK